jgi:hypothetical protein
MKGEFWRHGSNGALAIIILLVAGLQASGAWPPHLLLFFLGAILFFSGEYGFHRYAFHAPPMHRVPWLLSLQRRLHFDHHVEPTRLELLFLPFWFLAPFYLLTGAAAWAIWPHASQIGALLAGTSAAILYYEWVHYIAHIPHRPRTAWGRWIKKYHLWHHFKNETMWFGVTNPSFDVLMRSYAKVHEVAASGTTRDLEKVK